VIVAAQNKELVPIRVLQVGPGDFCRLAFQTVKGQSEYEIFYGGDPPSESPPPWTCRDGLLLETRQFKPCDFKSLDSVRNAFNAAAPIGGDYVEGVFHGCDPFSLKREPFLSRYSGYIDIRKAGVYGLITASQDCSFLLIDDKLTASAPGHHGPRRRAQPDSRTDVTLSAGQHKFEYYHAAAGSDAMMALAWEIDPAGPKSEHPTTISPEVFHGHLVGRLPAGHVSLRSGKPVPDFAMTITGDVPLPDNSVPLVSVLFRDISPKAMTTQGAKLQWSFGDGQTSDLPHADHVYLRPGLYPVTLSIRRAGQTMEVTNRVCVDRPLSTGQERPHTLDEFLKIIDTYDPRTLDTPSLRQLVLVLEAKSLELTDDVENAARRARAAEQDPNRRPDAKRPVPGKKALTHDEPPPDADRYLAKAVAVGRMAFLEESAAKGDDDLLKLAQLIGPMARQRLGDAEAAFQVWQGASGRMTAAGPKAECEIAAADVALNDLLRTNDARRLLEAAANRLGKGNSGATAAGLQRVWGDYYAAAGDGPAARTAYVEADRLTGLNKRFSERTALRGAHARSAEEFIKQKQFALAAEELQAWQREFPAEKIDGYLTLLYARYWFARGKYAQAIGQAEQLQAVNADSPYADQLLSLAAESELRLGHKERALATLHSLVKDYPGSPLAPAAKKSIEALEGGIIIE
jgi:TolA-binding protein/PKD repeat protein